MNNFLKRIMTLFAVTVMGMLLFPAIADAQGKGGVKARFKDSSTGEPLEFATVSITKKGQAKPSKYVLTDSEGKAELSGVPAGAYTFKVELLGYKPFVKDLTVSSSFNDLGEVNVDPDSKTLDAASVSATGNPIIIKKDTVEYNASSFKTTENDMLEDLLKKLPGVEIAEDGSITSNGKTINKITIDGKTFFLDDPQLASKNIPAKIVEKVKVMEKKSEQAEFTGIDDGETETVIDLSIQKGMMNGVFGNVMAGAGHDIPEKTSGGLGDNNGDWRYQGAAFLGRFSEKSQLSIILNGNNTNNRGFNDLSRSSMNGMRGGGGGMGRGGGGWGRGNGITTSWMGGVNANTSLFDDKMDLGGNYLYNNTRVNVEEMSDKLTYLDDYNLHYKTDGFSHTNTDGHRFGIRLEHKFSENTSIIFQPQVNFGSGDFHEFSDFETNAEYADGTVNRTNKGFSSTSGANNNWQTNGFLLFRQRLGIPGRTLSLMTRYSFSGNDMDGLNQSLTTTHNGETDKDENDFVNQRYDQNRNASSINARLTYTEPLGKGFYVEANYRFSWSRNVSKKFTYDSANNDDFGDGYIDYVRAGETFNSTYSNDILNRYINQQIGVNFMYQKENIRAQVGASANPTNTHNETNGKTYNSKVLNWAPQAMLWYDINDNSNLRAFYFGSSQQPSTTQLMPVPDNSNPLSVSFGNPYLEPYFNHNFRGEYGYSNKKTYTSIRLSLSGGLVQSPIVNATWYDLNGVQYAIPVNGHNSGNGSIHLFINSPIAKSNFSIFSMTRGSYSQSSSYIGAKSFDTSKYYVDGDFDYTAFHEDFPNLDKAEEFSLNTIQSLSAMQRLRFTYRNDFVEINLGGRTRISKSWYTVASASTNMTWNNQVQTSMQWTIPGGVGINTEFNYNWYQGYTTPKDDEYVFNAEITKLLFKKKFTLAVKAYDIFNQSKNLNITDSANYHQETWNNTLGRYIIVSLTYRFGSNKNQGPMRGGPGMGPGPMGHGPRR